MFGGGFTFLPREPSAGRCSLVRPDGSNQSNALNRWRGVRRSVHRVVWAVMDQGSFAASSFILNVVLARSLTEVEFGAFATGYSVLLLVGTIHTGLLAEPMLVLGSGRFAERRGEYLATVIHIHWRFSALVSFVFAIAVLVQLVFGGTPFTSVTAGLAVATPFVLFQWLMRRACYLDMHPSRAAAAGLVNVSLTALALYVLAYFDALGIVTSLSVVAGASLISGGYLAAQLPGWRVASPSTTLRRDVFARHLAYGKWAVGAAALSWLPSNVWYLLLPFWGGVGSAGVLRALMNVIMPMMQVFGAMGILLLPLFIDARRKGAARVRRLAGVSLLLVSASSGAYGVLIVSLRTPITTVLYGGAYPDYAPLFFLLWPIPLAAGLTTVMSAMLRAYEMPNRVFAASAVSSVVALTVGLWYVAALGLAGGATALLVSAVAAAVATAYMVGRSGILATSRSDAG